MRANKIAIAFLLTGLLYADSVKCENSLAAKSEITDVKVFTSGAIITRVSKITVEAGQSTIRFENLSSAINPASVNVSATGSFTILSVNHQLDYLKADYKSEEMIRLTDSLQNLNRKRDGLLNKISVLQEEQNLLLANKSVGGSNTGVKLEDLKNISSYFRERLTDIKEKITDYSIAEKKLKIEIDKLTSQLGKSPGFRNDPFSTIIVNTTSDLRASGTFTLTYFTGNVSWNPFYDIRVKDANRPVNIGYKAMVIQNTGEDWKNVNITISNGNPTLGSIKPEINPWYLSFNRPVMYRDNNNIQAAPGGMELQKKEDVNTKYVSDFINVTETRFTSDYNILIPYTILSNGLSYAVQIKDYTLPANYSYYAAPLIDKDAFLVASVTGWAGLDLQPGNANVYFENNYVGETSLNSISENDTMKISLGRDKRIVIKREKMKDFGSGQFIGGNRTRAFVYETTIRNNRKEKIIFNLEDQIPVSTDKEIEVKLADDFDGNLNPETGKLCWKIEIAAGDSIKKKTSYSVKHPKDKTIQGL